MKLSIIIPVYNTELYIERCLVSCLKQDIPYEEYEIVVVNDGSLDGSLRIAEHIAKEHTNITIVSQPNEGLSVARNTGLSIAKGKYVWFVDSDDWIAENCLNKILKKSLFLELDILGISKANIIKGEIHNRHLYDSVLENQVMSGKDALKKGLLKSVCVPFAIYRKEFLNANNLECLKGVFHEDNEFTPRAYYLAEKVGFCNNICYYAYERENSIMTTINPKRSFDLIKVAHQLHLFSQEKVDKNDKYIFHRYISNCINESLHLSANFSKDNIDKLNKEIKNNKSLIYHLLKSNILKYKIEGILFLIFPNMIDKVYKILIKIKS